MSDLDGFRSGLVGAIQGISGSGWSLSSGRCLAGLHPVLRATGVGFWRTCLPTGSGGSGALAVVGMGHADDRIRSGLSRFGCSVDMYCAIDSSGDTMSGAISFAEVARRALDDALAMGGTTYDAPEWHAAGPSTLAHFKFSCRGVGCYPPYRYLRNETDALVRNETGGVIYV